MASGGHNEKLGFRELITCLGMNVCISEDL